MLRTGKPCIRLFYIGLFFTSGTVSAANVAATGCTPAARRFERDKLAHISVATKNCAIFGRFIGAHLVKTAQATRKAVNVVHACNARLAPVWFGDERSTGTPQNSLFKDAHTGWTRRLKACTINRESGI